MGNAPRRQLARDTRNGRIGEVMDRILTNRGERVYLRPVGGGKEWTTGADDIQAASLDDDTHTDSTPAEPTVTN